MARDPMCRSCWALRVRFARARPPRWRRGPKSEAGRRRPRSQCTRRSARTALPRRLRSRGDGQLLADLVVGEKAGDHMAGDDEIRGTAESELLAQLQVVRDLRLCLGRSHVGFEPTNVEADGLRDLQNAIFAKLPLGGL